MTINFPEDFAVVIMHLGGRTDRQPLIEHILTTLGKGDIIEGYSPKTMPPKIHPNANDKRWSVTASKIKALQHGLDTGKEYIFLLEDDCCFVHEKDTAAQFRAAIEAAPDFDIMYGGWKIYHDNAVSHSSPCFRYKGKGCVLFNHCVLLHCHVAETIIKNLLDYEFTDIAFQKRDDSKNSVGPGSDVLISDMIGIHNWKCYLCQPQLAEQKGGASNNLYSPYREYPTWYPHSSITPQDTPSTAVVVPQTLFIPATLSNTLFTTICDYPNTEERSEMIRKTAEHCGVPLIFASWGRQFTHLYEKLPKMLSFLKSQPKTVKYVFFTDCRDTVFAKSVDDILAAFNTTYTGGVLVQCGSARLVRDYASNLLTNRIAAKYGNNGFACGGCYCGEIGDVILLLERAVKLYGAIHNRDYSNPLAALYLNDPNSKNSIHRLHEHDEFMFHLIQWADDSTIKADTGKKVSALFANDRPNQGHVPLNVRREADAASILSVGSAGILHSPRLSKNVPMWRAWVENNILKGTVSE